LNSQENTVSRFLLEICRVAFNNTACVVAEPKSTRFNWSKERLRVHYEQMDYLETVDDRIYNISKFFKSKLQVLA